MTMSKACVSNSAIIIMINNNTIRLYSYLTSVLFYIIRNIDMSTLRLFKAVIGLVALVSSTLLIISCSTSKTTSNSHSVSHTYEGHYSGGIGWH